MKLILLKGKHGEVVSDVLIKATKYGFVVNYTKGDGGKCSELLHHWHEITDKFIGYEEYVEDGGDIKKIRYSLTVGGEKR